MMTRAYMSFGAGVQSTTIALLAINKDPRLLAVTAGVLPELYIFADTGDEPRALYPHVEDFRARLQATGATFRIVRTPLGNLGDHVTHAARNGFKRAEQLPFFVHDSKTNATGISVERHCTRHFKTGPITAYARSWFGVYRGKVPSGDPVQCWLGLSHDEPQRLKTGPIPGQLWASFKCPLFDMRWARADCVNYLESQGVKAARSACVFCPFHSLEEWRRIREVAEDWEKALAVDDALEAASRAGGAFGFRSPLFLNKYGKRLRDLDLEVSEDPQRRLWDNECAGVCGV